MRALAAPENSVKTDISAPAQRRLFAFGRRVSLVILSQDEIRGFNLTFGGMMECNLANDCGRCMKLNWRLRLATTCRENSDLSLIAS